MGAAAGAVEASGCADRPLHHLRDDLLLLRAVHVQNDGLVDESLEGLRVLRHDVPLAAIGVLTEDGAEGAALEVQPPGDAGGHEGAAPLPTTPQHRLGHPRQGADVDGLVVVPAAVFHRARREYHRGPCHLPFEEELLHRGRGPLLERGAELARQDVGGQERRLQQGHGQETLLVHFVAQHLVQVPRHVEDGADLLHGDALHQRRGPLLLPAHLPDALRQRRRDLVRAEELAHHGFLLVVLRVQVQQLCHGRRHPAEEGGVDDQRDEHDEARVQPLLQRGGRDVLRRRRELC
mmetsp:Transcript_90479/g.252832  ORF Transcript_90479/g.252832 Transcript_90479/m.252832 type:complete len:292 (+) Transcript_90479:2-877(+)